MSDPVTNLESADVLTSLRRLVAVAPAQAAAAPETGCLVLAPAFRIAPEKLVLESPVPTSAASLAATIKELEAALGVSSGDWEPDGSEVADVAAHWPDMQPLAFRPLLPVEPAVTLPPEPAPGASLAAVALQLTPDDVADGYEPAGARPPQPTQPLDSGEDLTIDETALRAIVADVLRQELQGDLGERITRNVRKLVRREIFRVLNSDEMR